MSVLSQHHSITFDLGISAPVHVKELVGGHNAIGKRYMYQLMSTVQLPGSKILKTDYNAFLHTKKRMSVWLKNYKNICLKIIIIMDSLIKGNTGKEQVK